jgi:electron transport complex protein RnfA
METGLLQSWLGKIEGRFGKLATLALLLMSGIRERLELCDIPKHLQGAAITLITAGILAMAFMGFTGVDSGIRKAITEKPQVQIETQIN